VKKILIVLIGVPFLFWSVWIAFPEKTIQSIMENSVADRRISMEVRDIQKGLFYNFRVGNLVVKGFGGELVSLKNIHGRINPLGVARLRLELSIDGGIGSGDISGHINFSTDRTQAVFDFQDVSINDMPLFKLAGIKGTGAVSGRFSLAGDKGRIEFATANASFEPALFSGVGVPLNLFHSISGSIDMGENIIYMTSVSLEGKDVNARLKGAIKDNVMDLVMELMPRKAFLENPLFLTEVDKYKVSPGYYMIPVRGYLSL
jgi:type II secretion system protein N